MGCQGDGRVRISENPLLCKSNENIGKNDQKKNFFRSQEINQR